MSCPSYDNFTSLGLGYDLDTKFFSCDYQNTQNSTSLQHCQEMDGYTNMNKSNPVGFKEDPHAKYKTWRCVYQKN